MNVWLWGTTALLAGLVPCGWLALRESLVDAVVGVVAASTVVVLALLLLAEGYHRSSYFGLPLTLAVLSFVGSLLYLRFLGRHL